jgi:hypothetical protein
VLSSNIPVTVVALTRLTAQVVIPTVSQAIVSVLNATKQNRRNREYQKRSGFGFRTKGQRLSGLLA